MREDDVIPLAQNGNIQTLANAEDASPIQEIPAVLGDGLRVSASSVPLKRHDSRIVRAWCWVPEWIRDSFWPAVTPATPMELEREKRQDLERLEQDLASIDALSGTTDDSVLQRAAAAILLSIDAERERRSSAEARLTTVLGMVSIAASVAFGALTAVFGKGFQGVNTFEAIAGAGMMVYAVLQLVNALLASLRGLRRRGYLQSQPSELLPKPGETANAHLRRQMALMVHARAQHAELNSRKIDAMDVAHTALRNFVYAVFILSAFVAAAMVRPGGESPESAIITKLRADPTLIELLRGPRGSQGDKGLPGPAGQRGAAGERGLQGPPGGTAR